MIFTAVRRQWASFCSHCDAFLLYSFFRPYQSSIQSIHIVGKTVLLTQRLFFPSCRLIRCSRPHRTLLRCRSACFRAVDVVNEKTVTESSPFGNFLFTINRAAPAAHNPLVLLCSRCHSVAHTAPCRGLVVLQVAGCRVSAGVFLAPPPPTPPPPQRRDCCFLFLSGADPLSAHPTPRPYPLPHQ